MNSKLLLITCITLMYRQSQIPGEGEKSSDIVREIISRVRLPEIQIGIDHERDILDGLKNTAINMANDPVTHRYETTELLQQLRMNTGDDTATYEALRDGIESDLPEAKNMKVVSNMLRKLNDYFAYEKSNEIIQKAAFQAKFDRAKITDWRKFIQDMQVQLEPYGVSSYDVKDPAIISEIDVGDMEAMTAVYTSIQDADAGESILRTGWKGLNRMLQGGFRRGEECVVTALQHNYKTGFTLSLLKHFALYNKPFMINPDKKPLLLRISFEDTIENNFEFLYKSLWENENGMTANLKGLTPEDIATYVRKKLRDANGYEVKMLRVDPTRWTYRDICNKVIEYESLGYEVHALVIDYLAMVPTTGCTTGPHGHDLRDMFRRMRNFTNPRKITLITPHQFSTDAKRLIRMGGSGFVKEVAGKGYYAGCLSLDNELDLEIHIHIEKMNGRSYLTVQRGKHRVNTILPEKDFHCVLPFQQVGGILDDVDKAIETTLSRVGGGPIGSADEIPQWEFADA